MMSVGLQLTLAHNRVTTSVLAAILSVLSACVPTGGFAAADFGNLTLQSALRTPRANGDAAIVVKGKVVSAAPEGFLLLPAGCQRPCSPVVSLEISDSTLEKPKVRSLVYKMTRSRDHSIDGVIVKVRAVYASRILQGRTVSSFILVDVL